MKKSGTPTSGVATIGLPGHCERLEARAVQEGALRMTTSLDRKPETKSVQSARIISLAVNGLCFRYL
jgi:hypothetical protein